jgi:anti-sigma B factor antagonist
MSDFEITLAGTGLVVAGDLNVYSAADIKAALLAQADALPGLLAIDLSNVGEFDTAGLQLLLMLSRESRGRLRVRGCSEAVRSTLALCRLEGMIAAEAA